MIFGEKYKTALRPEGFKTQAIRRKWLSDKSDIKLVVTESTNLIVVPHLAAHKADVRKGAPRLPEHAPECHCQGRFAHTNSQRANATARDCTRREDRVVQDAQGAAHFYDKFLPCLGDAHKPMLMSKEHLKAKFVFQRRDLLRQTGLCNVQTLGSTVQIQLLNGNKQMAEL